MVNFHPRNSVLLPITISVPCTASIYSSPDIDSSKLPASNAPSIHVKRTLLPSRAKENEINYPATFTNGKRRGKREQSFAGKRRRFMPTARLSESDNRAGIFLPPERACVHERNIHLVARPGALVIQQCCGNFSKTRATSCG